MPILQYRAPVRLEPAHPIHFPGGRVRGPLPGPATGTFNLGIITDLVGSSSGPVDPTLDDWTDDSLQMGWWLKGSGWEQYKMAVLARGGSAADILETTGARGPVISFRKAAGRIFLGLFRTVVMIHGAPPKFLARCYASSTVGTRFILWGMSDRSMTGPEYSGWTDLFRAVSHQHLFVGAPRPAIANSTQVDVAEAHPWATGGPYYLGHLAPRPSNAGLNAAHSWLNALPDLSYGQALAAEAARQWIYYWSLVPGSGFAGFFHDNLGAQGPAVIHGEATNPPAGGWPTDGAWRAGITQLVRTWNQIMTAGAGPVAPLMGNVGDCTRATLYPDMGRQWWEYLHEKGDASGYFTIQELVAALQNAMGTSAELFFGTVHEMPDPDPYWTETDHPDLRALLDVARSAGRNGLCSYLMHSGGADSPRAYLYHGPTCPRLT